MPARKITINGVSNSFEWQVGNTTRFIKFEDITSFSYEACIVACGNTLCEIPVSEIDRFEAEYHEWLNNK